MNIFFLFLFQIIRVFGETGTASSGATIRPGKRNISVLMAENRTGEKLQVLIIFKCETCGTPGRNQLEKNILI
jgi:hypothetical protein